MKKAFLLVYLFFSLLIYLLRPWPKKKGINRGSLKRECQRDREIQDLFFFLKVGGIR